MDLFDNEGVDFSINDDSKVDGTESSKVADELDPSVSASISSVVSPPVDQSVM